MAIIRYLRKKVGKEIDFEIALGLTVVDLISRHYLPPIVTVVNCIVIFSLLMVFLYRQLRIPIKKNLLFLLCYGMFYFLLNIRYLSHIPNDRYEMLGMLYSLLLSVTFAYTLLATSKINNFYRCTFCGGVALLCIILLGKRAVGGLDNAFVIAQASITVLNAFTFVYWYEGKEYLAGIKRQNNSFFNVKILTNFIGGLAFFYYLFKIDYGAYISIWGLVAIVSVWYIFSIFTGIGKIASYSEDEKICAELTVEQLDRLARFVNHLRAVSKVIER